MSYGSCGRVGSPLEPFGRPGFSSANAVVGAMNLGTLLPLFVPLGVLAPLAGRVTARLGPRPPMVTLALVPPSTRSG